MAYNEISLPNWQQLVRRIFGLTGQGGNVPVLAPEIQPVVMVQPAVPEHDYLRGVKRWSGTRGVSGTVSTAPAVGVYNPAGSGRLIVLERIVLSITTSAAGQAIATVDTETNVVALLVNDWAVTNFCPRDTRV